MIFVKAGAICDGAIPASVLSNSTLTTVTQDSRDNICR